MVNTKKISYTAIGISLYVCLSMIVKIPVIGHIALDLGYIVFAVYCEKLGPFIGSVVGSIGCLFVSLLASGWVPHGWILGNIFIGLTCGTFYRKNENIRNIIITIIAVFIGIGIIKTAVECYLYQIPLFVKLPKNMIAFAMDSVVMSAGSLISNRIHLKL